MDFAVSGDDKNSKPSSPVYPVRAIENDGTENGVWLINGPNPAYNLEEDLLTYHGHTNYIIPVPAGEMDG